METVKVHYEIKIRYSVFFQKYYVFKPKCNGNSEMYSFDKLEEAEEFIEKNIPKFWWNKEK